MIPLPDYRATDGHACSWNLVGGVELWWAQRPGWYITHDVYSGSTRLGITVNLGSIAPSDLLLLVHAARGRR